MTHIEATASRIKGMIAKANYLLVDSVKYKIVDDTFKKTKLYETEISICELSYKLQQLNDYEVYQNIRGRLIPAINKGVIIRDLISLARQEQIKKFFEVRNTNMIKYFVVVEILEQKIIWEFKK